MVIDVDRCTGCGACMVACAVENNVPPPRRRRATARGITPIASTAWTTATARQSPRRLRPHDLQAVRHETPCVAVCPQQAVEVDQATGIVGQMPQRCLGCRYCMAACPYHARYFNWWDPQWPAGMEKTLNPAWRRACAAWSRSATSATAAITRPRTAPPLPAKSESTRRLRARLRRGLPHRRHSLRRPQRRRSEVARGAAQNAELPAAGEARHRTQGLLPLEARLGAADRRRPASRRDALGRSVAGRPGTEGESPWINSSSAAASTAAPPRSSRCGSCRGPACWRSACTPPPSACSTA